MSRAIITILLHLTCIGFASQAAAQDVVDRKVAEAITATKQVYGPAAPARRCGVPATSGEIVVCGPDRGEDQRIPSTAASDPTSRKALNDGLPRAPQLDRGSCKGQAGCMGFGSVAPPILYIDLKAIPDAPEGSDADLIAKGERAEP